MPFPADLISTLQIAAAVLLAALAVGGAGLLLAIRHLRRERAAAQAPWRLREAFREGARAAGFVTEAIPRVQPTELLEVARSLRLDVLVSVSLFERNGVIATRFEALPAGLDPDLAAESGEALCAGMKNIKLQQIVQALTTRGTLAVARGKITLETKNHCVRAVELETLATAFATICKGLIAEHPRTSVAGLEDAPHVAEGETGSIPQNAPADGKRERAS